MSVTPRRGYFVVPESDAEEVALLSARPEGRNPAATRNQGDTLVPPTPSTVQFIEEREKYRDNAIITKREILAVTIFAFLVFAVLLILGRDSSGDDVVFDDDVQGGSAAVVPVIAVEDATPILSPHSLAAQCGQHTLNYPPNGGYSETPEAFLAMGMDEEAEIEGWAVEQPEGECDKTLTYFLDSRVGLFYHLTGLAQAYSFAALSNRTFFIDDSLWDRGRWEDHFQPLPHPGCTPPSYDRMKACPRGTRHWIFGSELLRYHINHNYEEVFTDPKGHGANRKRPMFVLARKAFDEILFPSLKVQELIDIARQRLLVPTDQGDGVEVEAEREYVGMHLRKGDRHPKDRQWREAYIPLDRYTGAIDVLWDKVEDKKSKDKAAVWLATDSLVDAQKLSNNPSAYNFLSLQSSKVPALRSIASPYTYEQAIWSRRTTLSERIAQTHGMLVDFAMMTGSWGIDTHGGKKPLGVVCTVSSNVCKMAAVALGWEYAMGDGKWVNVDGVYEQDWRPTELL